jgi:hypothetical protein
MAEMRLIPAVAAAIAVHFQELGGRSIAVSEVDPFDGKTNVPTLPLAITALVGEEGTQSENGGGKIELTSDILVQFLFDPLKYKRQDGADTPFFAFYDYEALRDRLLEMAVDWTSPRGGRLAYRSLDVESDEFGVSIAFRLRIKEQWCRPKADVPSPVVIISSMCAPATCEPQECQPSDPCNLA